MKIDKRVEKIIKNEIKRIRKVYGRNGNKEITMKVKHLKET